MRTYLLAWLCLVAGSIGLSHSLNAQSTDAPETAWSGYSSPSSAGVTLDDHWEPVIDSTDDWWPNRNRADWVGVELGTIGLVRQAPDDQLLAFDQLGNPLLDANEMQGDMQFGTRAKVDIFHVWSVFDGTDINLGFFGINNLDSVKTLQAAQVSPIFFNSIPVTPPSTSDVIYSSNLYSAEANLRYRSAKRIRPLAGVRYFKLEDSFDAYRIVSGTRLGGFSQTNNSLWGGQFGAEATLLRWRSLDFIGNARFGLMHNRVEGSASVANTAGSVVVKNFTDSEYSSLIDGEAGIVYNFVSGLDFKVAYQCIYASKIATGIEQNASVNVLSPGETVVFGSQFWQGLNLSAQLSF